MIYLATYQGYIGENEEDVPTCRSCGKQVIIKEGVKLIRPVCPSCWMNGANLDLHKKIHWASKIFPVGQVELLLHCAVKYDLELHNIQDIIVDLGGKVNW